ncbi:MAG: histidine kinase [Atopobiaceae bacterium]|nr:histidine kinase [Atopobiaceae bacterium]
MRNLTQYVQRSIRVLLILLSCVLLGLLAWGVMVNNLFAALVAGGGLATVIVLGGTLQPGADRTRSQATERTLEVASKTLEVLRGGLTQETAPTICTLLLTETSATAIALTDTKHVLGFEGDIQTTYVPGTEIAGPTTEVLQSGRMETFVSVDSRQQVLKRRGGNDNGGSTFGIIVPLIVQDHAVGAIKLYYRRGIEIDRTQLAIAEGLGELLSTQLSSYELDRQAELTAKAEVKALQAQINPHFLFNTLNTIASLTRTNPIKARDLLREFSVFYRRTLESSQGSLIPLSQELLQTRRYLTIEKARFGEERIQETEHIDEGCEEVQVPSFLIQPIVENAVRHAMKDEGTLHIDIHVAYDENDILIAVADDGLGMDEETVSRLLNGQGPNPDNPSGRSKGTGIAIKNVAERVERFYAAGSGIEIMSKLGQGTCVTLKLADAALQATAR